METQKNPILVVFLGSIGSGKSYFARQLTPKLDAVRLSADAARLAMLGTLEAVNASAKDGLEHNKKLFGVLNYAAQSILASGKSVVFDTARFNGFEHREEAREIAKATDARLIIVWLDTPREVAFERALSRDELDDQRKLGADRANQILDFHYANFDAPQAGEFVIKISGQVPFETQYEQFIKGLADV